MANSIALKSISELIDYNFYIPSYQRGYRWTELQVTELLDDIWEFINKKNKQDDDCYCLQPIVVKKKFKETDDGEFEYELIDGQQRTTTLFLFLKYIQHRIKQDQNVFTIHYETRKDSEDFLDKICATEPSKANENIDYYHIWNAYKVISEWFSEKNIDSNYVPTFLSKVKVIFYEVNLKDNSIAIFTRINSGKIPLTNAELIKALFLNSSNFDTHGSNNKVFLKQLQIASEWDRIEYALQDDEFWYFLNNEKDSDLPTRIDFILNLMFDKKDKKDIEKEDQYATFHYFNSHFSKHTEEELEKEWAEVKKYFQLLEEWFKDRELYHKIGYLISTGVEIKLILESSRDKTKSGFKKSLDDKIKGTLSKVNLDEIEYGKSKVREVLLLHNILTMLQTKESSSRFPFDRYKKEKWDVEHIHAIADKLTVNIDDRAEWLANNRLTYSSADFEKEEDMENKLDEYISANKSIETRSKLPKPENEDKLFGELASYVLGNNLQDSTDSLHNLCLLDKNTNRSYKNASFKVKRAEIIEREMKGIFIPIATKNVFMKSYSKSVSNLEVWDQTSRDNYFESIQSLLNPYLSTKP